MNTDKIDKWGANLEARIQRWVQTETTFNFLRYTTGRILLAIASVAVLYGYGWVALKEGGGHIWLYPIMIGLVTFIQKISVRYAFDDDTQIDEFQHNRRNRAYRRAYKRVGGILLAIMLLMSWQYMLSEFFRAINYGTFSGYVSPLEFHMTFDNGMVIGSFLIGLFVIQKYLSWGLKGEPKA